MTLFTDCRRMLCGLAMFSALQLSAAVVFESAPFAISTGDGYLISDGQRLASRFHVNDSVAITAVGGNVATARGNLFAAIVALSGPTAVPSSPPSAFTPLAVTLFDSGNPSTDFRVPISVTLGPGDYGLIFGAGRFGAVGEGAMAQNCIECPGSFFGFGNFDPPDAWVNFEQDEDFRVDG